MKWLAGITDSMDMNFSKVKGREAWISTVHGAAKGRTWLSNWTTEYTPVIIQFSSVAQLCLSSVVSLWPFGLQHPRPHCPSPTPGVYSNSCPLNCWYHPIISSSVLPVSSHLQSFPASGSFKVSQLFASGGQSIRVSASASILPMNVQDWFPLGWTGWISLQSKSLLQHDSSKASILRR